MKIKQLLFIILIFPNIAFASFRIKDMVSVEGIRDNILVGYGLVVGLNGTGDNLNNAVFTQKGLTDFLERLGISTRGANLKTKNIAAVTVTATLPPFSRQGTKININISTLGDAKSLEGGTLLATPMRAADGEIYAVGQGPVTISQFIPYNNGIKTKSKSVTTNGSITNGAIIEKEINFDLNSLKKVNLSLHNPDITTATQIALKINRSLDGIYAQATDPATVSLAIPQNVNANIMDLLSQIEQIKIYPDQAAKIVIDEASGTVVINKDVSISPVAISQGNLSLHINPYADPSFPFANIEGGVISAPKQQTDRGEKMAVLEQTVTLKDVVDGLNSLGVTPRDLITILQNIKQVGALQAEIEVK
jgi:flagellar P-ring protein precursor FlgI